MARRRRSRLISSWSTWFIASYVIIIVMFALLWVFSLITPLYSAEEEQQYENLASVAQSGAALLESSDLSAEECVEAIGTDSIRATIIDASGTVLADSVDEIATMENHAERPEVISALAGQTGTDRRVSSTDGTEYLYLAVAATYDASDVVLRVSVPVSDITEFANTFRITSGVALIVALLLTAFLGFITFRRTSAPVNQVDRVRTNFVANASHELKTPVAGIRLLSESIEQACEDGDIDIISVFAQRLNRETKRLQNLVTELLDLARLEDAETTRKDTMGTDMRAIAATSYEGHVMQAHKKGIALEFVDEVDEDVSSTVKLSGADASLIVDNLLENAINYTEEGTVTLTVRNAGKKVTVEVADTGIGIPQGEQERIFERFYRVDTARSREMGGTGLGLSLVRHAVARADGTVKLKSEEGVGSTFTVALPKL